MNFCASYFFLYRPLRRNSGWQQIAKLRIFLVGITSISAALALLVIKRNGNWITQKGEEIRGELCVAILGSEQRQAWYGLIPVASLGYFLRRGRVENQRNLSTARSIKFKETYDFIHSAFVQARFSIQICDDEVCTFWDSFDAN